MMSIRSQKIDSLYFFSVFIFSHEFFVSTSILVVIWILEFDMLASYANTVIFIVMP
jgi:hypothetical protein